MQKILAQREKQQALLSLDCRLPDNIGIIPQRFALVVNLYIFNLKTPTTEWIQLYHDTKTNFKASKIPQRTKTKERLNLYNETESLI